MNLFKQKAAEKLLDMFAPELLPTVEEYEAKLIKHLKALPLQEGETHVTAVLDVDVDSNGRERAVFDVAAFDGRRYVRSIERYPAMVFAKQLLDQLLKFKA